MELVKPKTLQKGDKVATISLSWGGAGEIPYRYEQGKKQIQDIFGLEVVETNEDYAKFLNYGELSSQVRHFV